MNHGMTPIVQSISRLMAPFIWMFGFYIIAHGHLSPGGGFAGGVFLAGGYILLVLASGTQSKSKMRSEGLAAQLESVALLGFLGIATLGLLLKLGFMTNVPAKSHPGLPGSLPAGGLIPWMNLVIGIEVAAALTGIFIALAGHRLEDSK